MKTTGGVTTVMAALTKNRSGTAPPMLRCDGGITLQGEMHQRIHRTTLYHVDIHLYVRWKDESVVQRRSTDGISNLRDRA